MSNQTALMSPSNEAMTLRSPVLPQDMDAPTTTKSVSKALSVLSILRASKSPLGVSEIARRAGMPKTTAYRCLAVLEEHRFVDRVGTDYELSWHMFELGATVRRDRYHGLHGAALPYLCELSNQTQLTVQLAVLKSSDVIYLESVGGLRSARTPFRAGSRAPANCTALGKAILAFSDVKTVNAVLMKPMKRATSQSLVTAAQLAAQLQQARKEELASDRDEAVMGLSSIAAPVISYDGRAIAAVALVMPTAQFVPQRYAKSLRAAAAEISRRIARWPER